MTTETYKDRYGNQVPVEELLKNRQPNEQKAIKYFNYLPVKSGCFGKKQFVTDAEYLAIVNEQIGSLESRKAVALARLGLDKAQVSEIPPVCFQGYKLLEGEVKGINNDWYRYTENDRFVTPTRELTWIFFGNDQVFVYKARVDTCDNTLKSERTLEYFYKDVTAFASSSDSIKVKIRQDTSKGCGGEKTEWLDRNYDKESFRIVVPGEVFECPLSPEDDNAEKISGMKQKLREKKNT